MQIINVIKRFLDDPEAVSPVDFGKTQTKSKMITPGDYTPLKRQAGDLQAKAAREKQRNNVLNHVEIDPNVDYVEFYRRVKEFGADRKWTD